MGEIIALDHSNIEWIIKYINENKWNTFTMTRGLNHDQLGRKVSIKRGSYYYGYLVDGEIQGIIFIDNANMMTAYFSDSSVYKKWDLLKILRHHRPKTVKGNLEVVKQIHAISDRTFSCEEPFQLDLMMFRKGKDLNCELEDDVAVVNPLSLDFKDSLNFLLAVEKEFERTHLSINQIKEKVKEKASSGGYSFLIKGNQIVSQALVEFEGEDYALIGGIFTRVDMRNRGCGKTLSSIMTDRVLKSGKDCVLIVKTDNIGAKQVYENIGYDTIEKYGMLNFR